MKFLVICCIMLIHISVNAAETNDFIAKSDTENLIIMPDNMLQSELEPILARLNTIDPEFVHSLESLSPNQQLPRLRSYLAQKSFEYYDQKYTELLNEASKNTGRSIKTEKHDLNYGVKEENIWLDRGKLDDEDLCYNLLERRACDYPDGFEDFSITKTVSDTVSSLFVLIDDKNSNTHYSVKISLSSDNTYSEDEYFIEVSISEYTYDEWHAWRNQEMADIRAGKYIKVPDDEQSDPNSPFYSLSIKMNESRDWKSNLIPSERLSYSAIKITEQTNND